MTPPRFSAICLALATGSSALRVPFQRLPPTCTRAGVARMMEVVPDGDGAEPQPEQGKAKTKTDRFDIQFTCNVCESANAHSISRHAYTKGTVIVTCPSCKAAHLIADNLNWIEDDFRNLEEYMEKRGTPVTKVVQGGAAVVASAKAAARAPQAPAASGTRADGGGEEIDRLDGISEDMALRIRQAVRENKRRKAQEAADAEAEES